MSVTPTLAAMLSDPLLQYRYVRHIDNLIALVDVNNQQADGASYDVQVDGACDRVVFTSDATNLAFTGLRSGTLAAHRPHRTALAHRSS